ncbi:MAG: hypothetical protein NPIRA03_10070 [Nitrospirales bacterium]|nr:MAG: hypothetical protein NPIRA03_10070 [Nitrospirales bacterium]
MFPDRSFKRNLGSKGVGFTSVRASVLYFNEANCVAALYELDCET